MSDRINAICHRLENWGRWARDDGARLWYPTKAAFIGVYMLYDTNDREGWNDGAKDRIPDPIDAQDARKLDAHIQTLADRHKHCLKHWYYRLNKRAVTHDDHDAAVRALVDLVCPVHAVTRRAHLRLVVGNA